MLPIKAACSLSVENKNIKYVEEYIFPQSLLLWIKNTNLFDGIMYSSCSYIDPAHDINAKNVVIPALTIENNYCEILKSMFKLTQPEFCNVSAVFLKFSDEIKRVTSFAKKIEESLLMGRSYYLVSEMLSICKAFISWYNSITAGASDSKEALYQVVNTIVEYTENIRKHSDYYKEYSTKGGKHNYPRTEEKVIGDEVSSIIDEFINDIEPIISQFKNYSFKIDLDTELDYTTLEYI